MRALDAARIMFAMTRPVRSSKLLLVADNRPAASDAVSVPVRRYRLARLRFEGRSPESDRRFEHLKRVFD
jgi:hypothetical protein